MKTQKNQYFAYRSFWPELDTMKKFRECGVDTFMFMVSNTINSLGLPYTKYPPVWKWNNKYDLDSFDRQIGDILEAIPDAKLMCMVDLNTPPWWARYLGAFGVRYDSFYDLGKISASPTWRQDTSDYMQLLLRHAEKHYSNHMVAYVLGCGGATEWHDRSCGEESVYRLSAYRQWQREHGKKETDIPGRMIRDAGSHDFDKSYFEPFSYYNGIDPTGCYDKLFPDGFGLMRTPEKNQEALDYWRFCSEFNADTADFFLGRAREVVRPHVELGVFFGYAFGPWSMNAGHTAYERLLESRNLDFVLDAMGGSHGLTPRKSVSARGKRSFHEMDQRTYTSNHKLADFVELPDPLKNNAQKVEWKDTTNSKELAKKFCMATNNIWKTDDEIVAAVKRETAFCLISGDSLWWFDMWGGFYKGDKVFAAFKETRRIWGEQVTHPAHDTSEILLVIDPDNMYLVNGMDSRCGSFATVPHKALNAIGMPYSICSFSDIEKMNMEQFKLVILCHPFELTEKHSKTLDGVLLKDNRSILWIYGPGVVKDGKWAPENVEKVCGTPFKTKGVNVKKMRGWTSIYAHEPAELTPEKMRGLAEDAGCHAYSSKLHQVFANNRLVAIHTGVAESLDVSFPRKHRRVTELFSGRTYNDADAVRVETSGPDTLMFLCED